MSLHQFSLAGGHTFEIVPGAPILQNIGRDVATVLLGCEIEAERLLPGHSFASRSRGGRNCGGGPRACSKFSDSYLFASVCSNRASSAAVTSIGLPLRSTRAWTSAP